MRRSGKQAFVLAEAVETWRYRALLVRAVTAFHIRYSGVLE